MKVAILGARGFLGSNISKVLSSRGYEVTGYLLDQAPNNRPGIVYKPIQTYILSKQESDFDIVINLSAKRSTHLTPILNSEVRRCNFEIPRDFILKAAKPGATIINTSTYIQNFEGKAGETVDYYGETKEELSQFIMQFSQNQRIKVIDLFLFTIYGFGDRPTHLIPLLLKAGLSGEKIPLSPGNQLMNLLYIEDLVENLVGCLHNPEITGYNRFFLWEKHYYTVREIVETIENSIKMKINAGWGERKYSGHEMFSPWPIPMPQLPGFVAPTSLEKGLISTLDQLQKAKTT